MIRVAILSYWHVHGKDYTNDALKHPNTEVVAVWDENAVRGQKAAGELSVPFYESLDDLLAQKDIDGVVVTCPTNLHHEVILKVAAAGKHIFTEKVLAPTLKECNEIVAAVQNAGIKLTVSLPRLYHEYTPAIQDIVRQGILGQLTQVRVRLSHNGATENWLPEHFFNLEQCGGGALIDLGCHPMYLTRLLLGMPDKVSAHYGYVTGKDVEDNAVAILQYSNGALGIVEAGFVNSHSPFCIEVHGTEGTLLYGFPDNKLMVRTSRAGAEGSQDWTVHPLPAALPDAFSQWVSHIENGTNADENISLAVDLTALMEASNLSATSQKFVKLQDLTR